MSGPDGHLRTIPETASIVALPRPRRGADADLHGFGHASERPSRLVDSLGDHSQAETSLFAVL
jgi:hypothetical protein